MFVYRIFILVLSSFLVLTGCKEGSITNTSTNLNADFNLAVVNNISEPSSDGIRTISMTFSDKEGNKMMIEAGSAYASLEAGYYDVVKSAGDRLQTSVYLSFGDKPIEVSDGTMYVRRSNYEYDIVWELNTNEGEIKCTASDKMLYFESELYNKLSNGGTGTILRDQSLNSEILNRPVNYSVYLPEGYDESRKYPVLYILHGMGGNNNDWFTGGGAMNAYASAFSAETGKDMIIVSPDGGNLFYCNGYEHGVNYMSFFFEEFVPHIESTYAIKAERGSRAIAGLSMGGYGSLYYGLLHPEMFCHVYACSAAVSVGGVCPDLVEFIRQAGTEKRIPDLPGLTLEIGTEDFLFLNNETFVHTLNSYNVAYEYITRSGMHNWTFWNACSPKIIAKFGVYIE